MVYQLRGIPERWLTDDSFYQLLGLYVGGDAGEEIPVIVNLPASVTDDQLRGLGAAAASSGSLAMFMRWGLRRKLPRWMKLYIASSRLELKTLTR